MEDWDEYILGETAENVVLTLREQCQQASIVMVSQAQRSLYLWSQDLDKRLYDCDAFVDAVRVLACRSRFSDIRMLIQNPKAVTKYGHRLLELARRLSSHIELRQIHADYRALNEAFIIVDTMGLLVRPIVERYEGSVNFKTPLQAQEKTKFFIEVWEKSLQHPEFRRLNV